LAGAVKGDLNRFYDFGRPFSQNQYRIGKKDSFFDIMRDKEYGILQLMPDGKGARAAFSLLSAHPRPRKVRPAEGWTGRKGLCGAGTPLLHPTRKLMGIIVRKFQQPE
jgi:hypothetical protein